MSTGVFTNTDLDHLPKNLQDLVRINISPNEKILSCILTTEKLAIPIFTNPPQAIVITNLKLLITRVSVVDLHNSYIKHPYDEWRNELVSIENSKIKSVKGEPNGRVSIDYGKLHRDGNDRLVSDPLIIVFPPNWVESILKIIDTARRPQTSGAQQPSNTNLAEQLIKLAELREKGLITSDEFSEAKRRALEN